MGIMSVTNTRYEVRGECTNEFYVVGREDRREERRHYHTTMVSSYWRVNWRNQNMEGARTQDTISSIYTSNLILRTWQKRRCWSPTERLTERLLGPSLVGMRRWLVVLYCFGTWSFTLRMNHYGLGMKRVFEPKKEEVTVCRRKIRNKEVRNLHWSPNIVRVIESKMMRWVGEMKNASLKRVSWFPFGLVKRTSSRFVLNYSRM